MARQLSPQHAKQHAQHATRRAAPWLERLGRIGYAVKGMIYALIGILAAQAAFGAGGETTDTQGVLQTVVEAPFGQFLLGVIAVGFAGFAVWSLLQAIMDTENKGTDAKGIVARCGYAVVGLIHIGLAVSAVRLLMGGSGGEGGEAATQGWTASLLSQPFGQWLVALGGAIIIGGGLYHLYQAYSTRFRKYLRTHEMSSDEQHWAIVAGRFGYAAIGIVLGIVGGFLIMAALQSRPEEARGLEGALDMLAQQSYGPWLLGIVALGLVAYGVFQFVLARYRRMVIP